MNNSFANDSRITVANDESLLNDLCNDTVSFRQFNEEDCSFGIKEFLIDKCYKILEKSHRSSPKRAKIIGHSMDPHRVVTYNDCFTVLSKKHEFIAVIDFDEFIYPRSYDTLKDFYGNSSIYKCNKESRNSICSMSPLKFSQNITGSNSKEKNYFYKYIKSLINMYQNVGNVSNVASIEFQNAATMTVSMEKELVSNFDLIIKQTGKKETNQSILFPIEVLANKNHIFTIKKDDIDYVKYLYNSYTNFVSSCVYDEFEFKLPLIEKNLARAFYYLTSYYERPKKSVYHFKNTKSMGIHTTNDIDKNCWSISPSGLNGHFTPHYRHETYNYNQNFTSSINDLNIDFEYLFFILKNYANFC